MVVVVVVTTTHHLTTRMYKLTSSVALRSNGDGTSMTNAMQLPHRLGSASVSGKLSVLAAMQPAAPGMQKDRNVRRKNARLHGRVVP